MSEGITYLLIFVQAVVCAAVAGDLATKKGYEAGGYSALGFFFSIIGVIAAAGLPDKYLRPKTETEK